MTGRKTRSGQAASFWTPHPDAVDWPIDGDEQRTAAAVIASRSQDGSDWRVEGHRKDHPSGRQPVEPARGAPRCWEAIFRTSGPPLAQVDTRQKLTGSRGAAFDPAAVWRLMNPAVGQDARVEGTQGHMPPRRLARPGSQTWQAARQGAWL
jgi:hypothetical protein